MMKNDTTDTGAPVMEPYSLPPLLILTVLYLFGTGWREKKDCEQL